MHITPGRLTCKMSKAELHRKYKPEEDINYTNQAKVAGV